MNPRAMIRKTLLHYKVHSLGPMKPLVNPIIKDIMSGLKVQSSETIYSELSTLNQIRRFEC